MPIDKKFLNLFIKVTEKAAIGASKFIGKKDKIAADKGAVDPMRRELNKIIRYKQLDVVEMTGIEPATLCVTIIAQQQTMELTMETTGEVSSRRDLEEEQGVVVVRRRTGE